MFRFLWKTNCSDFFERKLFRFLWKKLFRFLWTVFFSKKSEQIFFKEIWTIFSKKSEQIFFKESIWKKNCSDFFERNFVFLNTRSVLYCCNISSKYLILEWSLCILLYVFALLPYRLQLEHRGLSSPGAFHDLCSEICPRS